MIYIKKFIEKVSLVETRQGKDIILPMSDARNLRDELAKLLVDMYSESKNIKNDEPVIQVEMKGGVFK
jgi:hypothetical protein